MWAEVLTKTLQVKLYRIMRINIMNMPDIFVDPGDNAPAKGSKSEVVSAKNKHVEFNQDVRMKYIPKITRVQTKSVKSDRPAKNPNSSTSVRRSVLAKLRSDKGTEKRNDVHYEKVTDKCSEVHNRLCLWQTV